MKSPRNIVYHTMPTLVVRTRLGATLMRVQMDDARWMSDSVNSQSHPDTLTEIKDKFEGGGLRIWFLKIKIKKIYDDIVGLTFVSFLAYPLDIYMLFHV